MLILQRAMCRDGRPGLLVLGLPASTAVYKPAYTYMDVPARRIDYAATEVMLFDQRTINDTHTHTHTHTAWQAGAMRCVVETHRAGRGAS